MKIVRGDGRDWSEDEAQSALRALYAPPADESYWRSMERRILAAVRVEKPREWWSYFPGWVRLGMSVAAGTVIVASAAAWHAHEAQEQLAAQRLVGAPEELTILDPIGPDSTASARAATLRYLITHD
ncbi:MAG: hypothetical protein ABIT38_09245 [Gemmatimonadaceae bacterium]